MNIKTTTFTEKTSSKFADLMTIALYGCGISAGVVLGLMSLLLIA